MEAEPALVVALAGEVVVDADGHRLRSDPRPLDDPLPVPGHSPEPDGHQVAPERVQSAEQEAEQLAGTRLHGGDCRSGFSPPVGRGATARSF